VLPAANLRLLLARSAQLESTAITQAEPGRAPTSLRLRLRSGTGLLELRLRPKDSLGVLSERVRERAVAYHGYLADRPGSWAALTRIGRRWTGMWYDGTHYVGIDSAQYLASISPDAALAPADSVMTYRLADAVVTDVRLDDDIRIPATSLESLTAIVGAELGTPATALAVLPTKRVSVALLADPELALQDGAATETNMLARLNIVDEIFSTQVGVRVQSGSVTIFNTATSPFTAATDPSVLLDEVAAYRSRTSLQRAAGFTHLMSGRNFDGQTVGIAYIRSVCRQDFGASLSEARNNSTFDALVAAHEIGHVFGAPHDGDAAAACPAAPPGFLMAPQLNGSRTFSQCSLDQMAPVVAAAQCLAPANAADASIEAPQNVGLAVNHGTAIALTVRSLGNIAVNDVNLRILLPLGITLQSATSINGDCSVSNTIVDCPLGTIGAGASTQVDLQVLASMVGTSTVTLRLTASNDALRTNDGATLQLNAEEGTDLALTATGNPLAVLTGSTTTATFSVENRGALPVTDARLELRIPTSLAITQQVVDGFVCAAVTGGLSCGPLPLDAAATARVTLTLRGDATGNAAVTADLDASRPDTVPSNNSARLDFVVSATPPTSPGSSGGGGGGGCSPLAITGLALLWLGRRRFYCRASLKTQLRAK
jgi:hypothetical protein